MRLTLVSRDGKNDCDKASGEMQKGSKPIYDFGLF